MKKNSMSFTKEELEFIEKADEFIISLPMGEWASTLNYSMPVLFMQVLKEYEGVYEIEYDKLMQNFRKIRSLI
jgi:hypothetical protein